MSMHMLQCEGAEVLFVKQVITDLRTYERTGRMPRRSGMRARLLMGRRETTERVQEYVRSRTFERWSKYLRREEHGRCNDCRRPLRKYGGIAPMLREDVWNRLGRGKDALLCDRCLRRSLGRPICLHDLVVCLFNVDRWKWLGGAPWTKQGGELHVYFDLVPVDTWLTVGTPPLNSLLHVLDEVMDIFGGVASVHTQPAHEAYADMQMIFLGESFKDLFLCQPVEDEHGEQA